MKIKANETTRIDYLGVFEEGTETELTTYQVEWFETSAGVPLTQENLPEGVELIGNGTSDEVVEAATTDPSFPVKEA